MNGKRPKDMSAIKKASSTSKGTSLFQLKTWAEQSGMKMQVAKRTAGAQIAVPAVMHRKLAHYGAITAFRQNRNRVQDPTFSKSSNLWMTPEAIDSESSGYFLVRAGNLHNLIMSTTAQGRSLAGSSSKKAAIRISHSTTTWLDSSLAPPPDAVAQRHHSPTKTSTATMPPPTVPPLNKVRCRI